MARISIMLDGFCYERDTHDLPPDGQRLLTCLIREAEQHWRPPKVHTCLHDGIREAHRQISKGLLDMDFEV